MACTVALTTSAPCPACTRAESEASAAWDAFRATSSTVAFISSMAVAVSPVRFFCSSAPRLACSTWAASSSEADDNRFAIPKASSATRCIVSSAVRISVRSTWVTKAPMLDPFLPRIGVLVVAKNRVLPSR